MLVTVLFFNIKKLKYNIINNLFIQSKKKHILKTKIVCILFRLGLHYNMDIDVDLNIDQCRQTLYNIGYTADPPAACRGSGGWVTQLLF